MNKIAKVEYEALAVSRVLLECALIVVSVVLGFLVSAWATHAREQQLGASVRRSIALEVADNLKTMEAQARRHYAAVAKLHGVQPIPGHTAFQTLFENLHGDMGAPMKREAWEAAVSSGALRLLDPSLVERYSEIYADQERVYDDDGTWLKPMLYRPENFDPQQQAGALATLTGGLTELAGNEAYMRDLYRKELPALQKAAR